jgi:hypothetical protein
MEIVIRDPNVFNRKLLGLGTSTRFDTLTDIKFLNDTQFVCANRQSAKVYLVEFNHSNGTYKILHSLFVIDNNSPFHFDLLYLENNTIYAVELSNRICILYIRNNMIYKHSVFKLETNVSYHGITKHQTRLILSHSYLSSGLTMYDTHTKQLQRIQSLNHLENKRIKQSAVFQNTILLVIACDGTPKTKDFEILYDSYLGAYNLDTLEYIGLQRIPNAHIDDLCVYNDDIYITAQQNNQGKLLIYKLIDTVFHDVGSITVNEFPHGIDIRNGYIGYTSYKNSSVSILTVS